VLEIRKDCPRLRHILVTTSGTAPLDGAPPGRRHVVRSRARGGR
jgi:hypothetical protein